MRLRALALVVSLASLGCVQPEDNPTTVKDLRVLGIQFETPEVLIDECNLGLLGSLAATDGGAIVIPSELLEKLAAAASRPLTMTSLIEDPAGNGRPLKYRVVACANQSDRRCTNEGDFLELARGETSAGELAVTVAPGALLLPDGTPLLQEVIAQDLFKGLGGFRVPVLLDVQTLDGREHIYAQKLMVYMCRFFPEMQENVTPVLPGLTVAAVPWPEDEVKEFTGTQEVELEPKDFSALQEPYLMPSFQLSPVSLKEAWKVSWYTTMGTFGSHNTGGVDLGGQSGRHRNQWQPDTTATAAQDVTLTFVVRDGRGGESWIKRKIHWTP
ncbi:MAG: hypothetical protein AMXMBFR34_13600 [Myxococcaceae bacterium]